ncbi:hypothetical protein AVEN_137258-1 [Araneus ventricosus]|uniref:Histone-lysine N-methyltransferase SETMAR n=1 Tax=Araneus ventricosus TaxID=182803 RepID=A0A4Y2DPY0_ARAVE|nr:hypothetical protein AVEN_137258-1 [Araneus ventricosus]
MLLLNKTINSIKYSSQLDNLKQTIEQKCPELANHKVVVFYQDNTTLHVSLAIQRKLLKLGWDVLHHSPCSPDFAPTNFHLFCSLQNSLKENFQFSGGLQTVPGAAFSDKLREFYESRIMKLPKSDSKL